MRPHLFTYFLAALLIAASSTFSFSQGKFYAVAEDDCGIDGRQRHLVIGSNWTFSEEEVDLASVPRESPLRSVSYGSSVLYRYAGLKKTARYKLVLGYLADKANPRVQRLAIDGVVVTDSFRLADSRPRVDTVDVPMATYLDGTIDVVCSLLQGRNAVVSHITLLSDDPNLLTVLRLSAKGNFAGLLSGRVSDANSGRLMGGASVTAKVRGGAPVHAKTDDSGSFAIPLPRARRDGESQFVQIKVSSGSAELIDKLSLFELFPDDDPLSIIPVKVGGVAQCRISLNGEWQFAMNPGSDFWGKDAAGTDWKPIHVPGECRMQGFPIEHDREYAYRRAIDIPSDFRGKRILVRFNGVYSFARVWVNGKSVRNHHGGFTAWECDVTQFVDPGKRAVLVVGITDRVDEISFGSGYAKHPIGGILRSVDLMALPQQHIRNCNVETRFDTTYRDARLHLDFALSRPANGTVQLTLRDPAGNVVPLDPAIVRFTRGTSSSTVTIPIKAPLRWDAEHPRLYTLEGDLIVDGKTEETIRQKIGFREVRVKGTQLLVNGQPVKLRGACRHDIHPLQGRSTTPEQDRTDVLLAKEANFNFIRTSHYPPSAEFLEYCDEYGIYVEEETAVCFVGTFREGIYREAGSTSSDVSYTERYLTQLAEMIDRDRHHPSVIIWSIGNENTYGSNFQKECDYVKKTDSSRPVMFSFPNTVPQGTRCWDIYSFHYPSFDRCLRLSDEERRTPYPILSDEWMHVACYCIQDLKEDPNIRNFWGESIKRAWENNFDSEQSIGGAIWGMIDESFLLPDTSVGYGPWGIVDVWRRKKPEFWHTRKAYSPVRLMTSSLEGYVPGKDLVLPIENRFDHTNLQEVQIQCTSEAQISTIPSPNVPPHAKGELRIPTGVIRGTRLSLRFVDGERRIVDEEEVLLASSASTAEQRLEKLQVEETAERLVARGGNFAVTISRSTGLIESGFAAGEKVIDGGPYVRVVIPGRSLSWDVDTLLDATAGKWQLDSMSYQTLPTSVTVTSFGHAGSSAVKLVMNIWGTGELITSYEIAQPPPTLQEIGLRFLVNSGMDQLSWKRRGLWSSYPDDHIGRPIGEASKYVPHAAGEQYRQKPQGPWAMDTKDFFLFRGTAGVHPEGHPVPNDFRGMKENIYAYTLRSQKTGAGVTVESQGEVSARAQVRADGATNLFVNNEWTYVNLNWGNYERGVRRDSIYRGSVTVKLSRGG